MKLITLIGLSVSGQRIIGSVISSFGGLKFKYDICTSFC